MVRKETSHSPFSHVPLPESWRETLTWVWASTGALRSTFSPVVVFSSSQFGVFSFERVGSSVYCLSGFQPVISPGCVSQRGAVILLMAHTFNFHTSVSARLVANTLPNRAIRDSLDLKCMILAIYFEKCVLINTWLSRDGDIDIDQMVHYYKK